MAVKAGAYTQAVNALRQVCDTRKHRHTHTGIHVTTRGDSADEATSSFMADSVWAHLNVCVVALCLCSQSLQLTHGQRLPLETVKSLLDVLEHPHTDATDISAAEATQPQPGLQGNGHHEPNTETDSAVAHNGCDNVGEGEGEDDLTLPVEELSSFAEAFARSAHGDSGDSNGLSTEGKGFNFQRDLEAANKRSMQQLRWEAPDTHTHTHTHTHTRTCQRAYVYSEACVVGILMATLHVYVCVCVQCVAGFAPQGGSQPALLHTRVVGVSGTILQTHRTPGER